MTRRYKLCCSLLLVGYLTTTGALRAQIGDNAYFQDAAVIGGTNSISITRLPVTAGGVSYYFDITLPFAVDAAGNVTAGPLVSTPSPNLITSAFIPGTYVGPATILEGGAKIVLAGPGVWNGKYSQWTISAAPGANACTYPESGAFYVGPLMANPLYSPRLKNADITSTAWFYGTGTSACNGYENEAWPSNGIIGVSQVGNTLTIASFSYYNKPDSHVPYDQITYSLTVP